MSQLLPERNRTGSENWSPLSELGQLNERMRRMLDQTFGGMLDEPAGWIPAVDIEELEDAYVVEAEVPGVNRKDVNIEVSGNELTIAPGRSVRVPRRASRRSQPGRRRREAQRRCAHGSRPEGGGCATATHRGQVGLRGAAERGRSHRRPLASSTRLERFGPLACLAGASSRRMSQACR